MAKARTPRKISASVTPIDSKPAAEVKKASSTNGNLEDEIRWRAYELYQERGGEHGFAHEDWVRAEAEVRSRYNRTA